jgi:indolepyruvate ferredoxin oxidoreductase beta subunit
MELGYDVKISEVHGMAQRGGSVVTYVRVGAGGEKVYSPIIDPGQADILLGFEQLEALRWLPYAAKGCKIFVNTQKILPMPV